MPRNGLNARLAAEQPSEIEMRLLGISLIPLSLAMLTPINREASAETLGDARVGFSAERILIIDGHSYAGKMWQTPGKQRHEQEFPTIKPVFILRSGDLVGEAILPQLHTIIEFTLPKELSLLGDPALLRKPIAHETVNGILTTKYSVDESTAAGHATGSLWLSDDGIAMRCDASFETGNGRITTIHWELRDVKIGKQNAALFEVPQGYAKLPPDAAAKLLGLRFAGHPLAR
jgi:hypothetical protein